MWWDFFLFPLLIILARICDVSLGTLRGIATIKGWSKQALIFGFFEVVIWTASSAMVLVNISTNLVAAAAYCIGYVAGIHIGIMIDRKIAMGDVLIRVLSKDPEMIVRLRAEGCRVMVIHGRTRDEPVYLLYVDAKKRSISDVIKEIREQDPDCFYTIDDVQAYPAPPSRSWT